MWLIVKHVECITKCHHDRKMHSAQWSIFSAGKYNANNDALPSVKWYVQLVYNERHPSTVFNDFACTCLQSYCVLTNFGLPVHSSSKMFGRPSRNSLIYSHTSWRDVTDLWCTFFKGLWMSIGATFLFTKNGSRCVLSSQHLMHSTYFTYN